MRALAWLVLIAPLALSAEPRYVNDHLIITLRSGAGDEYRILKSLPSGTRLELLETPEAGDFVRVRTSDGVEGWVRGWYLSETPTARLLLDEAEARIARLVAENTRLTSANRELRQARDALDQSARELRQTRDAALAENETLKDVAARPMELESENKRLAGTLVQLRQQNQTLAAENKALQGSSAQKWFMAGGGVLLGGVLLGLILPRLRRQGSGNWWT